MCECKRRSTCKGWAEGKTCLYCCSEPTQTNRSPLAWRARECVCVFNSVRVCVQPLSCSKNNPLLRIFNPQVTALSSLLFLALYRTLTHLMCILYTQLHTHTYMQGWCGRGGGVSWCKASQNSGLVGVICFYSIHFHASGVIVGGKVVLAWPGVSDFAPEITVGWGNLCYLF